MSYWVTETTNTPADGGPGGMVRWHIVAGPFATKGLADAKRNELGEAKRRIYEDRSLPGETRKRAMETTYRVWSDEEIAQAKRAGITIQ